MREPAPAIADAVVVLGARVSETGRPSQALARRVALGVALFHAGLAPRLVLSGGGRGRQREAQAMRDLALAAGVPEAALLIEPRSRNTLENALETTRLLGSIGGRRIVLVSDRYHLLRAGLLFRAAGIRVVARHAPAMPPLRLFPMAVEIVKLPVSLLRLLLRRR